MAFRYIQHICSFLYKLWDSIMETPLPWLSLCMSILSGAYLLGRYLMAAKKDKEIAEKLLEQTLKIDELERQHRNEIYNLQKDRDEWREKYLISISEKSDNPESSP